jgi:hypothetical protein
MKKSWQVWHRGEPADFVCLFVAYFLTARFAAPAHHGFLHAVQVHALPFSVALVLWHSLGFWQGRVLRQCDEPFVRHLLGVARAFFIWTAILVLLAVAFHPSEVDPSELTVFSAVILLALLARPVIRLCIARLPAHAPVLLGRPIAVRAPLLRVFCMSEEELLSENRTRGSPLAGA